MSDENEITEKRKYTVKEILLGKVPKNNIVKWMGIMMAIFFSFILICYLLYPGYYSIFLDSISFLGNWEDNPDWWWLLSIALILGSVSLFPTMLYIHRRLVKICPWFARFITFLGIIAIILLAQLSWLVDASSVEMFGTTMAKIHGNLAGIALGGIAIVILFYGFIYLKDAIPKLGGKQQVNWVLNLIPYVIFLTAAFGMGIGQLVAESRGLGWPKPDWPISDLILGFPFWEWMALFGMYGFFLINIMILPENFDKY